MKTPLHLRFCYYFRLAFRNNSITDNRSSTYEEQTILASGHCNINKIILFLSLTRLVGRVQHPNAICFHSFVFMGGRSSDRSGRTLLINIIKQVSDVVLQLVQRIAVIGKVDEHLILVRDMRVVSLTSREFLNFGILPLRQP